MGFDWPGVVDVAASALGYGIGGIGFDWPGVVVDAESALGYGDGFDEGGVVPAAGGCDVGAGDGMLGIDGVAGAPAAGVFEAVEFPPPPHPAKDQRTTAITANAKRFIATTPTDRIGNRRVSGRNRVCLETGHRPFSKRIMAVLPAAVEKQAGISWTIAVGSIWQILRHAKGVFQPPDHTSRGMSRK